MNCSIVGEQNNLAIEQFSNWEITKNNMTILDIYNKNGEKSGTTALPAVFDVKFSVNTVTQYFNYLRAARRAPVANTKNRGEVSGGGRKPWRQKGTGNARVGSTRSPLWIGGGVTFGPTNDRNFRQRINKNMRRMAILSVISKIAESKKLVVADLDISEPKTKKAAELISGLNLEGKIAVIISENMENLWLALRNIAGVRVMSPRMLDFIYLLDADNVVMTEEALNQFEEIYGATKTKTDDKS
ncbi:MAG: 50S ribosomal protein L4 [Patescibacteria group bacterium]